MELTLLLIFIGILIETKLSIELVSNRDKDVLESNA